MNTAPALALAAALVAAAPALASPKLELEVGAGAAGLAEVSPTFTGRVGVDLMGWFTPSLRVMSLTPLSGDAMGWSVLAELRAHSPGRFQVTGGVGMGVATAGFTRSATGAVDLQLSRVSPYLFADLGVRVMLGPVFIGASIGGAPFAGQYLGLVTLGVAVFGD
jgi:hypothetical protein